MQVSFKNYSDCLGFQYLLINTNRLFWLKNKGFTSLVYSTFTSKSVSPENILITGVYYKN